MNVLLVQGTWGDDDAWWRRGGGSFADAVVAAGHTLVNGRPFEWSTGLGGWNPFSSRDLNGWRAAGRHLYDRCDPPQCAHRISDLAIIGHSHARQVIKYACHYGLVTDKVILVSGPIRADVDAEACKARANIRDLTCLVGGRRDRLQWLGALGDWHVGVHRTDPEADRNLRVPEADHGSLVRDPAMFHHILRWL